MTAQGLLARLRHVVSRLSRAPQPATIGPARPAPAGATRASDGPAPWLGAPRNWLDDARRLRPHLSRGRGAPRRLAPVADPPGAPRPAALEHAAVAASAPSASDARTARDASDRPPFPAGAPAARQAMECEAAREALGALEGLDPMQRRLVVARYLVRKHIYNEGFAPASTPEQYRWPAPDQPRD